MHLLKNLFECFFCRAIKTTTKITAKNNERKLNEYTKQEKKEGKKR